jgi:hypothetical protein
MEIACVVYTTKYEVYKKTINIPNELSLCVYIEIGKQIE